MTFTLRIDPRADEKLAAFTLHDSAGRQVAARQVRLADHSPAEWEGAFDARRYVRHYERALRDEDADTERTAAELLEKIGVFLGSQVLGGNDETGRNLLQPLLDATSTQGRQTLIVELAGQADNLLTAAFANVPWEIARPAAGSPTLLDRNVVVRAVAADMPSVDAPLAVSDLPRDESLKVLLVFAEAPGSRPLAMRQERRELLDLLFDQVLRHHNVQVDTLCHGVTRERLEAQIKEAGGYHIVHWSGHGNHNCVELVGADGRPDRLTGEQFVQLFRDAGNFQPHLVFLSACLSGSVITVKDWATLRAAIEGERGAADADRQSLDDILADPAGFTGMALQLLRAGVPQVIAMRYEVGDTFARELAGRFYGHLLADPAAHDVDDALGLARGELLRDAEHAAEYFAVDHATPLMFGRSGRLPRPARRKSKQFDRRQPRPWPVLRNSRELDSHEGFVGRSRELVRLAERWVPGATVGTEADCLGVALIQGLAGLGKTALAAEMIDLWHDRFEFVLAVQAKPLPLSIDDFYRELHTRLNLECRDYREDCQDDELRAVFIAVGALDPDARYQRMQDNLLRVLDDWRVLLVIDNYEPNLEDHPVGGEQASGASVYRSADPRWDALLRALAHRLPETPSRLILTSRHRPQSLTAPRSERADCEVIGSPADRFDRAAINDSGTLWLPLGRLPLDEAAVCIRTHSTLRRLAFADEAGMALVRRLLEVSGGHPLILDRLSRLAADRQELTEALDALQARGWQSVPHLFEGAGTDEERERERQYLEDVSIGAVDLLLQRLSPNARQLLRVLSLAFEPQPESVVAGVWSGKSAEDEQLEQLRGLLAMLEQLPPELREQAPEVPPELQALLDGVAEVEHGEPPVEAPPIDPLLAELHSTGLVTREVGVAKVTRTFGHPSAPTGHLPQAETLGEFRYGDGGSATFDVHELVRERVAEWFEHHPDERGGRSDTDVRIAYGERYADLFQHWHHAGAASGVEHARDVSAEAGRRALRYLCRAGAFGRLSRFASEFVTSTVDPRILREVIAELTAVADSVPPGRDRWYLRTSLADGIRLAGQPEQALPLYEQAASEAESAGDWSDVAVIRGNHANALGDAGKLPESRAMHLASAEASRQAEKPEVHVIGSELEALRIDLMTGGPDSRGSLRDPALDRGAIHDDRVHAEITARVDRLRGWWQAHQQGRPPAEAPDRDFLGRCLVSGLDIAGDAARASARAASGEAARTAQVQRDWQTCLDLLDEIDRTQAALGVSKLDRLRTRFNQYGPLIHLFRLEHNPQRLSDAEQLLLEHLEFFKQRGEAYDMAKALSALADVWDARGDARQAADLERQALALKNSLPDALPRSISHNNLANYLDRQDAPTAAAPHRLAALVYLHELRQEPWVQSSLRNLAIALRGGRYELPGLEELLSQGEFAALARWLDERGVDRAALQQAVDARIDPIRRQIDSGEAANPLMQAIAARLAAALEEGPVEAAALLEQLGPELIDAGVPADRVEGLLEMFRQQVQPDEVDQDDADEGDSYERDDDDPLPRSEDSRIELDLTRGGDADDEEPPADDSDELDTPWLFPVWFGTNRQPKSKTDLSQGFTSRRSPHTYHGVCEVSIPRSHRFGSVGSGWFRRLVTWTDDRLKLQTIRGLDGDGFWQAVREDLAARDDGQRQALVFLHGYNVSFEEAAIRAAQVGFDLKVPGATAFFSWPSGGKLFSYRKDGESIQASEAAITEFLVRFARDSGAERVHLIAHSMGNRGLLRAMQRIADRAADGQGVRFGQIFLAAPDVDVDVFTSLADRYPQLSERTTLYVSPQDKAVSASQLLHGFPRVGLTPPVTVFDGIDTIEVQNTDLFDLFDLNHGYFATAAGVLHDMFDLLRRNASPDERQRPTPVSTGNGSTYWKLQD